MAKSTNALHVGVAQLVEPHVKKYEAETLRKDIETFLKNGGKIQKLGNTPLNWNGRPKAKKVKKTDSTGLSFRRKKQPSTEPA